MMIEEMRGAMVDDLHQNVDFTFNGLDPQVEVHRFGERFETDHPYVILNFLPSNIPKFKSVSDVIGKSRGEHYQYGFCQVEVVSISAYVNEYQLQEIYENRVNGRLLCDHTVLKCLERVLKAWDDILGQWGAVLDTKQNFGAIRDSSYYDSEAQTQIYNYDIDLFIRTSLVWDKVVEPYDESDEIAESAMLEINEPITNKKKIYVIKVS